MIAGETWRNSLLDGGILSPWRLLGQEGLRDRVTGRAAAPGPGEGKAHVPVNSTFSWPGKCSESADSTQGPLCRLPGLSLDPDVWLMLAAGGEVASLLPV